MGARETPVHVPDAAFLPADGGYRLQAPLLFASVPRLRPQGLALIDVAAGDLRVDLSEVAAADSAGLALLIDWLACARSAGKQLSYVRVPAALMALAQLSDVAPLLGEPDQGGQAQLRRGN